MHLPEQPAATPTGPAVPWYRRVLPVVALLVAAVAAAAELVPGVADELRLSTSRQPEPGVELYFPQPMVEGSRSACRRHGDEVRVGFAVRGHDESRERLRYRVLVDPDGAGPGPRPRAGRVRTRPDRAARVVERFSVPAGRGYRLRVELPRLDQHLQLNCPGGGR